MSDVAVTVRELGKEYHIGAVRDRRYRRLGERIAEGVTAPFRRARKLLRGQATGAAELDETIWALRDVSFEVARGEVVGIIGHNGAGKTTLLKILSRITEPTEGLAEIRGRVGSLLEVGTGFHPELTGRENVYLNGAILGMTRSEIDARFDEIVAFSEVEKFIDTPIKHYSSGMALRLAFAVAAHLEPEILIVDEVLAVGDAAFQRKCLGKMGEVAHAGRTVLLVSHNMSAITQLCERALLLESGRLVAEGPADDIVGQYLATVAGAGSSWIRSDGEGEHPESEVVFESIRVVSADGPTADVVPPDEEFQIEVAYRLVAPMRDLAVYIGVLKDGRLHVLTTEDVDSTEWAGRRRPAGSYVARCTFPAGLLGPGEYTLNVGCHVPGIRHIVSHQGVVSFSVAAAGYWLLKPRSGAITPRLKWDVAGRQAEARQAAR